jgi:CRISPR/Cas system CSM-associated protein Csm3 (group 7 of RAMP superfamily)
MPKSEDQFHHPYHFIPTTGMVNGQDVQQVPYSNIKSGKHSFARHDLWHKEGISGTLTCSLILNTPTFVGDGSTQGSEQDNVPNTLLHYKRNRYPAIPANSLRGMVGSLVESLSQSALRVLHDEQYSVRQKSKDGNNKHLGMVVCKQVGDIKHSLASKTTHDFFPTEMLPLGAEKSKKRDTLTPAEMLLGVVELLPTKKSINEKGDVSQNLASRVRFTDAISDKKVTPLSEVTLKILDRPKPPSPAMYFHPDDKQGDYIAKDQLDTVNAKAKANGRKYYLHHHPDQIKATPPPWQTRDENDRIHQKMRISPLEAGQCFEFKVHFDNLSAAELELLKTALCPESNYQHRLGYGKPLGLGSVSVNICTESYKSQQRYSIDGWQSYWADAQINTPKVDTTLIDAASLQTLRTLGNPAKLTHEVRPPLDYKQLKATDQNARETETFNWFVENDNPKQSKKQNGRPPPLDKKTGQRQALRSVGDTVPTLHSDWKQVDDYADYSQHRTELLQQKKDEREVYINSLSPVQKLNVRLKLILDDPNAQIKAKYTDDAIRKLDDMRTDLKKLVTVTNDQADRNTLLTCLKTLDKILGMSKKQKKDMKEIIATFEKRPNV